MKKKLIKILSLILVIILVFEIYTYGKSNKLYYVALGDSLTVGLNSYGKAEYGYTDYIKDYLVNSNKLRYYKNYAQNGYETSDIIKDISNNLVLKKDLRESDIVTLTIGANDFFHQIDLKNLELKSQIGLIIPKIDDCLKEIRKYAQNKIIIIGYYNPSPFLFNTNTQEIDEIFKYIDSEYNQLSKKYNCIYISIYETFKNNKDYLPNPNDIHPNIKGYQEIANMIIGQVKM